MKTILYHIKTRTPLPNNTNAVGFVNSTSIPVWRMLSVGSTIPGSGMAATLIGTYREVIAADYAITFLGQFTTVALSALQKSYQLNQEQQKRMASLRNDAQRFQDRLTSEQATMYGKVRSVSSVVSDLERLERALRTNLPTSVLGNLSFSARHQ